MNYGVSELEDLESIIEEQSSNFNFKAEYSIGAVATRPNALGALARLQQNVLGRQEEINAIAKKSLDSVEVKLLSCISSQDDINMKNCQLSTALHIAAFHGQANVVKAIIEAQADVQALDKNGLSPLDLACDQASRDLLMAAGTDGWTQLMIAAKKGQEDIAHELLTSSAEGSSEITKHPESVTKCNRHGRTALHVAAEEGHASLVRILTASGADVNARDLLGQTPLDLTEDEQCKEILKEYGSVESPALIPGISVRLSLSFKQHDDAADGPLRAGDIGILVEDDGSSKPYLVEAPNGIKFWYARRSVTRAV